MIEALQVFNETEGALAAVMVLIILTMLCQVLGLLLRTMVLAAFAFVARC